MHTQLETLASYVPAVVLKNLPCPPLTEPFREQFPAAVFFADISGFSALTEHLVQSGANGVEELSIIINAYFGQLIDLVIAHGGDIVEFTGDGIIALWSTPLFQEDLATVTHRAAQCGLAAQQILSGYEPARGTRLLLRIGIGAGEVLATTVGGVLGRWELLVAGHPLVQASAAQKQARPGDVVISPEAWGQIQQWSIGYPVGYGGYAEAPREMAVGDLLPTETEGGSSNGAGVFSVFPGGIRLEDVRTYLPPRPIPTISLVPEMIPTIRAYLPAALLARLDTGQTRWVAELRNVTVLFVNITGLDYDAPDILSRLQEAIHLLQRALYHYEGSLNQFIVDDKGTLLIAAMGLPPLTHEDDPVRGVQLALDIQGQLRQAGLRGAIGITTGLIFCGSRGSNHRRDYAMIGSVMNLAARLMQAAPDDVLCDEPTCHAARALLTFDELPPLQVKGKTEPVSVYRPHQHPPVEVCHLSPIVGRAPERALLMERLRALRGEQVGSVVIIEGDAGMGKSRLIEDMARQAQAMNVVCLKGLCDAIEQATPYFVWRTIFWQLFHLEREPNNVVAWRNRVFDMLDHDEDVLRLAPLLNSVLPLEIPPNEITAPMSAQVRADNTRDLLLRVLWLMTRWQPTLIVLESANLMDSASWVLAIAASHYLPTLFLVITTRPLTDPGLAMELLRGSLEFERSQAHEQPHNRPGLPTTTQARPQAMHGRATEKSERLAHSKPLAAGGEEYRLLLKRPGAYRIVLENLSPDETTRLACTVLGVDYLPDLVASFIFEKSQGNPLFVRELAFALRDAGMILIEHGTCTVATDVYHLHTLDFPETIQGVILSRVDRLTQRQQLALKVASVIGFAFGFPILHAVYPIEEERATLPRHLRWFEQLGIISRVASEPEQTYTFTHRIMQEVIYHTLLFAQRRDLHRTVAEWYEQNHPDDLEQYSELLAHHWSKAGEQAKAIAYSVRAGVQALRSFANQEAVCFLSQALSLVDGQQEASTSRLPSLSLSSSIHPPTLFDPVWLASLERQLGEAYLGLGKLPESREHLEKAAALLGQPVPTNRLILGVRIGRQIVRHALRWFWPLQRLSPAGKLDPTGEIEEAVHIYRELLRIYYFAGESLLTGYAALRCLNLAECKGSAQWLPYAYANMCITVGSLGEHRLAVAYARKAMAMAWQVADPAHLVYVLNLVGLYHVGCGNWRQARAALDLAITFSEHLGDWTSWGTNWTLRAQVAYYRGEFARSFDIFAQLSARARRRNDSLQEAWAMGGKGQNALRMGRLDEACLLLEAANRFLADNAEIPSQISNTGLLATAHLHRGDLDSARAAAERAIRLIADTPVPSSYYLIEGYAGVAEVVLSLWERSIAAGSAEQETLATLAHAACKRLLHYARHFPIGKPRALLWHGLWVWLKGEPQRARRAWERSLAAAEKLGMGYEQGLAHSYLGRYRQGNRWPIHLERAREQFAQLGAQWEHERVQHAIASAATACGAATAATPHRQQ
jgi:class 3 adenylate cyclase/tetratricopeptide (TPR) repeat protein